MIKRRKLGRFVILKYFLSTCFHLFSFVCLHRSMLVCWLVGWLVGCWLVVGWLLVGLCSFVRLFVCSFVYYLCAQLTVIITYSHYVPYLSPSQASRNLLRLCLLLLISTTSHSYHHHRRAETYSGYWSGTVWFHVVTGKKMDWLNQIN